MNTNNSSHTNETLGWSPRQPLHTRIALWSILLVWSLLGNVLVIAVVYCDQRLRTMISNYLIVSMAVSDMLIPLVAVPYYIARESVRPNEWLVEGPLDEALCKLVPFLFQISPYVSSFNVVIIAFQRFVAIVYPTRMEILTRKTRWILIPFPWILAMALSSPLFYILRLNKEHGYTICDYSWAPAFDPSEAHMTYMCIIAIIGFLIPLIAIISLYSIIQYKLRKNLNNVIEALIETQTIRVRQQRNRRIMNMAITIILVFTICWCPLGVLQLMRAADHHLILSMDPYKLEKLFFAFSYLWYLQTAINPCIYFLFLRDFRRGLRKLCCRKTASENEQRPVLCVCCVSTVETGGEAQGKPKKLHDNYANTQCIELMKITPVLAGPKT